MDALKQNTGVDTSIHPYLGIRLKRIIVCVCTLLGYGTSLLSFPKTSWAEDPPANSAPEPPKDENTGMGFNAHFLHGQAVDLTLFSRGNPVPAGEYKVLITLNNHPRGRYALSFRAEEGGNSYQAQPCFTLPLLKKIGIALDKIASVNNADPNICQPLSRWAPESQAIYDTSDFTLQLVVAQKYLARSGMSDSNPDEWDAGINTLFVDYSTDLYSQASKANRQQRSSQQRSISIASLFGINIEGWRVRYRQITRKDKKDPWQYQSQSAYAEHDVTKLKSQFRVGETWTSGELFDSLTFRGIQLRSDHRMLPSGLRNYTPLFTGIAETNANVTLWQHGELVQQLSVPPGPFEIDSPVVGGYGGDYTMVIEEADGRKRTFIVPNSAPPLILNKSVVKYELAGGRVYENLPLSQPNFVMANIFYGLTENYTLYSGLQSSARYKGFALGNAFNTSIGGIALTLNHAQAKQQSEAITGKKANLTFSKYIVQSQTNINFSSDWVWSGDYSTLRQATFEQQHQYAGVNRHTRQRTSLSIGQPLNDNWNVNLSGSLYRYKNNESMYQYSVALNKQFRSFSLGGSLSRSFYKRGVNQNSVMLSVSIPLNNLSRGQTIFDSVYSSLSKNNSENLLVQNNLTGHYGQENMLTYGLGVSTEKNRSKPSNIGVQANLSYNNSIGQYSSSLSENRNSRQYSLSASGSLVAHPGGITAGRQLGNHPFAILYVPGAEGARVVNGSGAKINHSGYSILPYLTPYQENKIAVNPEGLPLTVSIEENEVTAVPRMGAAIKVAMKTKSGIPILLKITDSEGNALDMMSEVYTLTQPHLAIVGQGSRAFIQGWKPGIEKLFIRNPLKNNVCEVNVNNDLIKASKDSADKVIYKEVVCK